MFSITDFCSINWNSKSKYALFILIFSTIFESLKEHVPMLVELLRRASKKLISCSFIYLYIWPKFHIFFIFLIVSTTGNILFGFTIYVPVLFLVKLHLHQNYNHLNNYRFQLNRFYFYWVHLLILHYLMVYYLLYYFHL